MNKYCFHIDGGAGRGGHTLTARSNDHQTAMREANRRYHPSKTRGPGRWIEREAQTGPDANGDIYMHYDWVLSRDGA